MGTAVQLAGISSLLNNENTRNITIFLIIVTIVVAAIGVYISLNQDKFKF